MKQIESFAIESPCQQICRFNRQRYCRTCMRHMDERIAWDNFSDEEKRAVLRKCHRRKLAYRRAAYLQFQEMKHQQHTPRPQQQLSLFERPESQSDKTHNLKQPNNEDSDPQIPLF
ncbi:DUF1289 domain-containing protein [Cardiobacteriaceae bacterium TAE3-ERU3]|nr:DUF1289 domain-containing protein [Cardiobacteriaceae bacterium TAE3-ERU3]